MPDKIDGTRRFLFDDENEDILKIMERDIKQAKEAMVEYESESDPGAFDDIIENTIAQGFNVQRIENPDTNGVYLLSILWQMKTVSIDMQEFGQPQSPSLIANTVAVLVPDSVLADLKEAHPAMYGRPFALNSIKHESVVGRAPDLDYGDVEGYQIEAIKTSMYYEAKTPSEAYRILGDMTTKLDFRYIWNKLHVMFMRDNSNMPAYLIAKFEQKINKTRELPPPQTPDIEGRTNG